MSVRAAAGPLFFATDLAAPLVARLAAGVDAAADVDPIELGGDDVVREFGVPFLAGMDEIDVSEASFSVNVPAESDPREATYQATQEGGGSGVYVSLPSPGRLIRIGLKYDPPPLPPATLRVVVRPAVAGASGFTASPPVFASPAYPAPGPMFGPVLGGLSVTDVAGGGRLLTMPATMGSAWLVQVATGSDDDGAGKLAPLALVPTVDSVLVDALPTNFAVRLAADGGDVTLWSRPGLFLRGGAPQPVSFLPLARKQLTAQLKSASGTALTLRLKFHSDSPGRAEVSSKRLSATYLVRPLAGGSAKLALRGGWTPLTLSAPAGLAPLAGAVDLTAALYPRALNGGSPEPPTRPSGQGLRLTASNVVATALPFAPLDGAPSGSVLPLASARVLVEAVGDSELALEVRGDAAGVPGPVLAGPLVKQLKKGFADWLELELKEPLPVSTGGAPVWVALRLNRGEVRWFADPGQENPTRLSDDKGRTWAEAATPLASPGAPLTQLFHALADPIPAPAIQLRWGDQILAADLAAGAERKGPRELSAGAVALPASLLAALAGRPGSGRADTELRLFSRGVVDLSLDDASISYDPFALGATKGS